jgi:DNA polymerase-3 subunit beta
MHFRIQKQAFLRSLARTHGIADRKSSMHILSNILLSAEGESSLRLSATDLYLGITALCEAKISKPGSLAVAAKTLFEIVKNLPDGDIEWKTTDSQAAEILCGKVRFRLPVLSGEDFPPLPNSKDAQFLQVPVEVLGELISQTQYSMSHDDTRPHLAGSLFEGDGKVLRMVTTDGHRLSKAEYKIDGPKMTSFSMLRPHKGVAELKRLIEEVKTEKKRSDTKDTIGVATLSGNVFFQHDSLVLNAKLAEEQFPPYQKVIPQKQTRRVVILRNVLVEALKRISLVASDKSGSVEFRLQEGQLRIQSQNPDIGEGSEELDVDYAGEALSVGFKARYVLDVLTALPYDEVALELGGELDPGVIKPVPDESSFVGVIMPMRI